MIEVIKKIKCRLNSKRIVLSSILFLLLILSVWGIKATYAYYDSKSVFSFLGTSIGDFDVGDGDINLKLYMEGDNGEYNLASSIPLIGYILNNEKTKCPAEYTIKNNEIMITTNEIVTCKFYFDQIADADIKVNIMLENDDGSYTVSEIIPAYGYSYKEYSCDNTNIITNINYNSESRTFSFVTTGKNVCNAYFNKVGNIDMRVNVYIQEEVNSQTYELHDYIPSYKSYKLSTIKTSYCTNSSGNNINSNINYINGEITISSNQSGNCYVYLDIN